VQDELLRAEVLAALEAVDLVVIFEQDTPLELITQIKPSVLVKAAITPASRWSELSRPMAAKSCWSIFCRATAPRRQACAREQGMTASASDLPAHASPSIWRNTAAWMKAGHRVVLMAISLPWSTSLVAIFAVAWLVLLILTAEWRFF
jgi:hypothetical protein